MAVPRTMRHRRAMGRRDGYTLIELLVALTLLGILLSTALPPLGKWRDRAAVRAARDELAGAIAWTRIAAASSGGAALVVDPASGRVWTRTAAGDDARATDLHARYGVKLDAGSTAPIRLHYDAFGIGRTASRTLTLRRGDAAAGVTVSSYGRYRKW